MSYCSKCDKDTNTTENKFSDVVHSASYEYLTVYVASCSECGECKSDECWVDG